VPAAELTGLLRAWSDGDASALDRLTPIVYDELHRLARLKLARLGDRDVLQPSALVNEAFLRLMANQPVDWANRTHFFAHSAILMRRILSDFVRARRAAKRSPPGGRSYVTDYRDESGDGTPVDLLDLDRALEELGQIDERLVRWWNFATSGGWGTRRWRKCCTFPSRP